tara:strand:- start:62 stop:1324 length:1263 start_codon:yes stop_codon:yes gene_type:complete
MSKVKFTYNQKEVELDVIEGSEKERAIDITKLRNETGLITIDPGYGNTGSCVSNITFIDGEKGVLNYRGYPVDWLCENSNFVDVCYLLIYGSLDDNDKKDKFRQSIRKHASIPEDMKRFFDGFPSSAHPMAILSSMVTALSTFHPNSNKFDEENINQNIIKLLAKVKTIAAYSYRKSHGLPFIYPDSSLPYVDNFLHMMFSDSEEEYHADPIMSKALNLLLILHADHEQNCSTSTVRMAGSSHADLFSTISAGISALWGPRHGGANQGVIEMLDKIHQDGGDYHKYIDMAKDKNNEFRLMGFGHRVYKNYDPRAKVLKASAASVLNQLKIKDPLLDIARELEQIALKDEYFVARKLYPNVDFYSGIIYRAMGIPTDMFTVMFALGRLPGWLAHWKEMMMDPKSRINRPRQIYFGPTNKTQ